MTKYLTLSEILSRPTTSSYIKNLKRMGKSKKKIALLLKQLLFETCPELREQEHTIEAIITRRLENE